MKPPKPKSKDAPRVDVDTVREIAGEKVFARGEACFRGGSGKLAKASLLGEGQGEG